MTEASNAAEVALRTDLERVEGCSTYAPGEPMYESLVRVFNGAAQGLPMLIVVPSTEVALSATLRHLGSTDGIPVAVRSGGHNVTGVAATSGAVCIDLRRLAHVHVDQRRREATVGGGASWAQLDAALAPWGWATTGGTFDTTGIAGLTLGGGIGHLMSAFGLACDRLLAARVVATTGEVVQVDDTVEPEMMRLLRGSGHGLGVTASMTFALAEVPLVVGGVIAFGADKLHEGLACFERLADDSEHGVTVTCLIERVGLRAEPGVVISVCSPLGDHASELRRLRSLVLQFGGDSSDLSVMPYLDVQRMLGRLPYGQRHYWSSRATHRLKPNHWTGLLDRFAEARLDAGFNDTILIEALGGAVHDPPLGLPSCVSFRDAAYNVTGMSIWLDATADGQQQSWARSVTDVVSDALVTGARYVNYQSEFPDGQVEVGGAAGVRGRLDPTRMLLTPALARGGVRRG